MKGYTAPLLPSLLALLLSACNGGGPPPQDLGNLTPQGLVGDVRRLAQGRGIGPLEAPAPVRPELVDLGQALLFDKVLSFYSGSSAVAPRPGRVKGNFQPREAG